MGWKKQKKHQRNDSWCLITFHFGWLEALHWYPYFTLFDWLKPPGSTGFNRAGNASRGSSCGGGAASTHWRRRDLQILPLEDQHLSLPSLVFWLSQFDQFQLTNMIKDGDINDQWISLRIDVWIEWVNWVSKTWSPEINHWILWGPQTALLQCKNHAQGSNLQALKRKLRRWEQLAIHWSIGRDESNLGYPIAKGLRVSNTEHTVWLDLDPYYWLIVGL